MAVAVLRRSHGFRSKDSGRAVKVTAVDVYRDGIEGARWICEEVHDCP